MRLGNCHITTTSTLLQLTRKHRHFVSPIYRQRSLCRRTRRRLLTGKEQDAETGLYYYGARYLDPRAGRWLSGDPAVSEYIPSAPVNDEARKRNESLPGMGGVFNYVNLHVYHYAGNNPVKYTDPDGKTLRDMLGLWWNNAKTSVRAGGRQAKGVIDTVTGKQTGFNFYINTWKNLFKTFQEYNENAQNYIDSQNILDNAMPSIPEADRQLIAQHSYDGLHGPEVNLFDPTVNGIKAKMDEILNDPNTLIGIGIDQGTGNYKYGYLADDGTLIIHNPSADEKGTIFHDKNGRTFFRDFKPMD